jgi:hypothetical protein
MKGFANCAMKLKLNRLYDNMEMKEMELLTVEGHHIRQHVAF